MDVRPELYAWAADAVNFREVLLPGMLLLAATPGSGGAASDLSSGASGSASGGGGRACSAQLWKVGAGSMGEEASAHFKRAIAEHLGVLDVVKRGGGYCNVRALASLVAARDEMGARRRRSRRTCSFSL